MNSCRQSARNRCGTRTPITRISRRAVEIEGNVVYLKRVEPFDVAFHQVLAQTLSEWASDEDEEAFGAL